ncbi:MAG: DUF6165 family protein [Proteobacteria bacterium]|nr:DUF6165 family protein [Pseudomonadota bacterium]
MSIKIDISVGELLDKISILKIKTERISDPIKLENINKELAVLTGQWQESAYVNTELANEIDELKAINERLWEIEDAIREKERLQLFDKEFIELARSVYFSNDKRAKIKHVINSKTGSELIEEKSYEDYGTNNE